MSSTRSQRLWSGVTSSASPQHTTPRPLPGRVGSSRCIYQNLTLSIPAYIYTMQCVECRSLDAKVHAAIHASVHHEQDITIYIYLLGCSNTTATKLRRRCFTCVYVSVARTVDSMHGVTKHAAADDHLGSCLRCMCGRYLVQTQHWSLRFDPTSRGDKGPLNQRWYSQTALLANQSAHTQWVSLRGPHTRAWSEMPEMESWRANHTAGRPYSGIGWFWARIYLTSPSLPPLIVFKPGSLS